MLSYMRTCTHTYTDASSTCNPSERHIQASQQTFGTVSSIQDSAFLVRYPSDSDVADAASGSVQTYGNILPISLSQTKTHLETKFQLSCQVNIQNPKGHMKSLNPSKTPKQALPHSPSLPPSPSLHPSLYRCMDM